MIEKTEWISCNLERTLIEGKMGVSRIIFDLATPIDIEHASHAILVFPRKTNKKDIQKKTVQKAIKRGKVWKK